MPSVASDPKNRLGLLTVREVAAFLRVSTGTSTSSARKAACGTSASPTRFASSRRRWSRSFAHEPSRSRNARGVTIGTTTVRKVWNGRANMVELEVHGPQGHIEGLSLRLYNPDAHQWSLNFSNSSSGTLSPPVYGELKDGRGEFFGRDSLGSRAILVRFVISPLTRILA